MHDDDAMDRLLRSAMSAEAPRLSPAFEAEVLRRVRPRRLTPAGRTGMVAYGVAAVVVTAWLVRGLNPVVVGAGLTAALALAAGAGFYAQRLVARD